MIESADAVVAQLETPIAAAAEAFALARARGVRTILNPAPAVPGFETLLPLTDLCVPNETELEALTALPTRGAADLHAALDALRALGASAALVTIGSAGSVYRDKDRTEHVPAFAVPALDPTAAGDAYVGSLAVSLAEGMPLLAAMRRASAAAALAVTREGAQSSFPTREEVEAFLAGR